jgi:uncharacterized LabA/DUF88 family protein
MAEEARIALFIDFENIALGLKQGQAAFDVQRVIGRLLDKGRIIAKKAYADWNQYSKHTKPLHEAGIELIQIPRRGISGKNSADIRLVVDALDMCYTKEHVDTFVIASGDSDFAPLVSKLREENKSVIGVGLHGSTSPLLSKNCDEFLYYEELVAVPAAGSLEGTPAAKKEAFARVVEAALALRRENQEVLWSSLIKDTIKRKWSDFSEGRYGYHTFGDLLEDVEKQGLIELEREASSGGTYVVTSVHVQQTADGARGKKAETSKSSGRRTRARKTSGSTGGRAARTGARKSPSRARSTRKRPAGG